jgi:hypothetical protein
MDANEEDRLIDKLRKIEALFAGAATPGERTAAGSALERIRGRLLELEESDPAVEYRFSLADGWSRRLFIALLRRYGLRPYRFPGQRRTTVMVKITASFMDEVLLPEFKELSSTLREHLESVTERIIREAIHGDNTEVEEQTGGAAARVGGAKTYEGKQGNLLDE